MTILLILGNQVGFKVQQRNIEEKYFKKFRLKTLIATIYNVVMEAFSHDVVSKLYPWVQHKNLKDKKCVDYTMSSKPRQCFR